MPPLPTTPSPIIAAPAVATTAAVMDPVAPVAAAAPAPSTEKTAAHAATPAASREDEKELFADINGKRPIGSALGDLAAEEAERARNAAAAAAAATGRGVSTAATAVKDELKEYGNEIKEAFSADGHKAADAIKRRTGIGYTSEHRSAADAGKLTDQQIKNIRAHKDLHPPKQGIIGGMMNAWNGAVIGTGTGAATGIFGGMALGAMIGTGLIPIPIVGTAAGALLGMVGAMLGAGAGLLGGAVLGSVGGAVGNPMHKASVNTRITKIEDMILQQAAAMGAKSENGKLTEDQMKELTYEYRDFLGKGSRGSATTAGGLAGAAAGFAVEGGILKKLFCAAIGAAGGGYLFNKGAGLIEGGVSPQLMEAMQEAAQIGWENNDGPARAASKQKEVDAQLQIQQEQARAANEEKRAARKARAKHQAKGGNTPAQTAQEAAAEMTSGQIIGLESKETDPVKKRAVLFAAALMLREQMGEDKFTEVVNQIAGITPAEKAPAQQPATLSPDIREAARAAAAPINGQPSLSEEQQLIAVNERFADSVSGAKGSIINPPAAPAEKTTLEDARSALAGHATGGSNTSISEVSAPKRDELPKGQEPARGGNERNA